MLVDIESLVITPKMVVLIAEVDEFKGAWQLLGKVAPEKLASLKKVATIESIGSSTRIEGAKLSDQEVESLLAQLHSHSFRSCDEQEVAGYALVNNEIFSNFAHIPCTENYIKHLHSWLLKYSDKDQKHKGEYKKIPNNIEAIDADGEKMGVIFETVTPFETPYKMEELIGWVEQTLKNKSLHPLLTIGIFVSLFLAIHPFQDGNGRLSRCLTTLLLLQNGYSYVPYSSLERIIEENKESYYLALRRTQQSWKENRVDYTPWLGFFLRSLQTQKRKLEEKISKIRNLSLSLPKLSAEIYQLLSEHEKLTIHELQLLTHANRNTLKKHLQELTKASLIKLHGKGRGAWYSFYT
jgi:Fic family protein